MVALDATPWVATGLDDLLERTRPFGPAGGALRAARVLWFTATGGRLRLFRRLHGEVVAQVERGHNVVVETALMDPRARLDAARRFAPLGGLFVGVRPPMVVSERWEAQRGDRPRGQARKHYALIHGHGVYDLVLDPSAQTPEACVRAIRQRLHGPPPAAFRRLRGAPGVGDWAVGGPR